MWSVGSSVARGTDIFLGAGSVIVAADDTSSPRHLPLAPGTDAVSSIFNLLAPSAKRANVLRVWVSGALARPFIVGPLPGTRRWREVMAVAEAMAPGAAGLDGSCSVWADSPVHRAPGMAVAMLTEVLQALREKAGEHAMRLVAIRPWWSAAFNAGVLQRPHARLVVVDDGEALTTVQGGDAGPDHVATQWPAPDAEHRTGWFARQVAGRGLKDDEAIVVRLVRDGSQQLPDVPFGAAIDSSLV